MPNFEIDPVHSVSCVPLRVRFGETDLMGIVHHASYVVYFEAARVSWLRRRGVTYQAWAAAGIHLPVVDIAIQYKRPAKFDDELIVETTLSQVTRPIEAAVSTVPGVIRVSSTTARGSNGIDITFSDGTDMLLALQRVQSKITEARALMPPSAKDMDG